MRQAIKKIIAFIAFSVLVNTFIFGQWEILNQGSVGRFKQIDFVNDNVGWGLMVGIGNYLHPNLLQKTNDFGKSWSDIDITVFDGLFIDEIDFVSDSAGWILVGDKRWKEANKLYYTQNGGASWELLYESAFLEKICAVNKSTVFLVKDKQEVLRIKDNEAFDILPNIPVPNIYTYQMWFKDSLLIFIADKVNNQNNYFTTDGGQSWENRSKLSFGISSMQFIGDSLIYFTGDSGLYKSSDLLQTWSLVSQLDEEIIDCKAISTDSIYIITMENIWLSTDGGVTIEAVKSLTTGRENSTLLNFNSRNEGFLTTATCLQGVAPGACNEGRIDFRSDNKGGNWKLSVFSYPITDACFINENKGFVAGGGGAGWGSDHGEIFVSNDGGKSWELRLSFYKPVQKIQFLNETTGYALVNRPWPDEPAILKTSDGGDSWHDLPINDLDYYGDGNAMYFTNVNTGWYVDNSNDKTTIWETKDGGQTWSNSWGSAINSYAQNLSIHFSESVGWVVGSFGRVIKYENSVWQEIASPTTRPLDKVYFYDAKNGWIISDYDNEYQSDPKLFRTEDGGITWESSHMNFKINDLFFEDSKTGWAVGKDTIDNDPPRGILLQTTDGGLTWNLVKENIGGELTDIEFKDGYLWAVGNNGMVLKNTDKITLTDIKPAQIKTGSFHLDQNYPNPFTDITVISYTLSEICKVDLGVYNLQGQKVTTLVSKEQTNGSYEVEWDATSFADGVYIYRLSTGDFVVQKKLLLRK